MVQGKGSERNLLRSVSLKTVDAMRTGSRSAVRAVARASLLLTAVSLLLTIVGMEQIARGQSGAGQIPIPRYRGQIEAPVPQAPTLPTPTAITPNGVVVEDAIVRVNDQIIDRSDYERAQQQLVDEAKRAGASPDELAAQQKDLLRDMIDQQLLLSRGKELEINVDAEVIRQMDDIRKKNNFDTMEDLEKAIRQSGITVEDFKANIKNRFITQQVERDEVGRTLRLTAKEEQAYYEKHKQEYARPESVRLSEILIATPDGATDEQVAQAKAKADDVEARLKAGAVFEDLARQMSSGQTASKGGDLGEFKRGALGSKALEDPSFALKAGEWTEPIRTRQGFVVLKATEHAQAGIAPLSAVDEQVQEAIYSEAIQPALRTYLTGLREKAFIEIEAGFVDTGASAKQTVPVFAAATPLPTAKKTSKKARLDHGHSATASAGATTATAAGAAKAASARPTAAGSKAADLSAKSGAKTVSASTEPTGKRHKKTHREKIRFGQAPRTALPAAPEESKATGADQGSGTTVSDLGAPGAAIATISQTVAGATQETNSLDDNSGERRKTRYSDRAPVEDKARRDAAKAAKAKAKAVAAPTPVSDDQKTVQQLQSSALGLNGDTATKKKKKRAKGEAKARLQDKAPTPPAPKPDATPIPPKSVRVNGEPAVAPAPDPSTLSPVVAPASVAPSSATPTK